MDYKENEFEGVDASDLDGVFNRQNRDLNKCFVCGKRISGQGRRYCDGICALAARTVTTACPICGKKVTYDRRRPRKTCSADCLQKLRYKNRASQYMSGNIKHHKVKCFVCGKRISGRGRRYCDDTCALAARSVNTVCPVCGDKFVYDRWRPRQTCSTECKHELIRRKRADQDMSGNIKYHELTCRVCGKKWQVTGTEYNYKQRQTCSDTCSRRLASKQAVAQRPVKQQAIQAGIDTSPLTCMNSSKHHAAKWWHILTSGGDEVHVRNLHRYLRHAGIVDDEIKRYAHALSRIRPDCIRPRKTAYGYSWLSGYGPNQETEETI